MKLSNYFLPTLRENPGDAEIVSHQLMLRAGMIRKIGSGIYTWLPLGLRVLRKIEQIIREEMNAIGSLEINMPSIQPAVLWQETDRWDKFGPMLLKFKDRNQREYCYGPTHEEIITDLARHELTSYKQLPVSLYQIQTKFRDEIRPRYGVMRAREFLMKDAYSFHENQESLKLTYQHMYDAYQKIFTRLGLHTKAVLADTGSIGGSESHEFHVLADAGEDTLCISDQGSYAANLELTQAMPLSDQVNETKLHQEKVHTPHIKTVEELINFLNISPSKILKAICVKGANEPIVMILLRGDHDLNLVKAEKHPKIANPLTFVSEEAIERHLNIPAGFIGPFDLKNISIIADHSVHNMRNFVCGANEKDYHYKNANLNANVEIVYDDLRNVKQGDVSPDGHGHIILKKGIEVGHIFQLGDVYSKKMGLTINSKDGKKITPLMGCYGIGVSRIVAAAIEQRHDEKGIRWPWSITPFDIIILPIGYHKSKIVKETADSLYSLCQTQGIECLLDDRDISTGIMFTEAELIGIPHLVILSEKKLAQDFIECKNRFTLKSQDRPLREFKDNIKSYNEYKQNILRQLPFPDIVHHLF